MEIPNPMQEDINKDLGLGTRVSQQSRLRFLNRDGSFNVGRRGISFFQSLSPYHALITMAWWKFNIIILLSYLFANTVFAFGYYLCGPDALKGATGTTFPELFLAGFFFSVQTLSTIGYGHVSPNGILPNILVTLEALVGLLGFALATGMLFARFSRPTAKIIFSKHAVIAPYKDITAFEFRIANERTNQLIEVEAKVLLSRFETADGKNVRKFYQLNLERQKVVFLPLHWVIVHPINEESPLFRVTKEQLEASDAEILILLTAVDETFSQTVHARSSYKHHEVVWNAKFADMFQSADGGKLSVDLKKINEIETVAAEK